MLKKIIHYFTSRSLEKHRHKTQCMIDEYEREAASSQARVQNQANAYKLEIQQLAQLREEQLKNYVQFLNDHIEKTTDYMAHLKELTQVMYLCVETWLRKSISEQCWKLEKDKAQVIHSTISYLDELMEEMIRLSRKEDRSTWQALIAERPLRIVTSDISKHAKRFQKEAEADAKAFDKDLRRIRSHKVQLRKQQSELRKNISNLKADVDQSREQHRQVKQRLQEVNQRCGSKFRGLQEIFENFYQYSQSESALANEWISQMPHGGTLREINQVLIDSKPDWEDAKSYTSDLNHRRRHIQVRIEQAYENHDYSTIDADKAQRSGIFQALSSAREQQDRLFTARQVFVLRREEIKKLMGWINEFHPSKTIEQVFTLLSRQDADIYWPAIGLATKTLRPSVGRYK